MLSEIEKRECGLGDLLIEMDRILRPHGFVVLRDKPTLINYVLKYLPPLGWDAWSSIVEPGLDAISSTEERVLIARKKFVKNLTVTL